MRQSSGITLIEILISLAIIFTLMGLSFAGYAGLNQRQTLVTSGQKLKSILRDVQSRAFTYETDCSISACNCTNDKNQSLKGWIVDFNDMKFFGECNNGKTFSSQDFSLHEDVAITPIIDPPLKILFKPNPAGADKTALLCLESKNLTGKYFVVTVNTAGMVSDCGSIQNSCSVTCTP
jgi:Tfp pilus assembly protein FimT